MVALFQEVLLSCDWRWSSINCSWTRKWSRNTENYCLGNFEQHFRNDSHVCGDWHLHHDNAPEHSSNLVQQFLSKHSIVLLRQPPYSPEIAPCDFWLFPKLKKPLTGQRFDDKTTVENNATSVLKAIPKSEFQDCFEKKKHRWNRVIQLSGDYFKFIIKWGFLWNHQGNLNFNFAHTFIEDVAFVMPLLIRAIIKMTRHLWHRLGTLTYNYAHTFLENVAFLIPVLIRAIIKITRALENHQGILNFNYAHAVLQDVAFEMPVLIRAIIKMTRHLWHHPGVLNFNYAHTFLEDVAFLIPVNRD